MPLRSHRGDSAAFGHLFSQDGARHVPSNKLSSARGRTEGWDAVEPLDAGFVAIDCGAPKSPSSNAAPPTFWYITVPQKP